MPTSNLQVLHVPPELIGSTWLAVAPLLLKGLTSDPNLSIQEVADHLVSLTMQLWAVLEDEHLLGAFLTSVNDEGYVTVFALGASDKFRMPRWIAKVDEALETFALSHDCSKIRFAGRSGYRRLLHKYKIVGRVMDQEIYERTVIPHEGSK